MTPFLIITSEGTSLPVERQSRRRKKRCDFPTECIAAKPVRALQEKCQSVRARCTWLIHQRTGCRASPSTSTHLSFAVISRGNEGSKSDSRRRLKVNSAFALFVRCFNDLYIPAKRQTHRSLLTVNPNSTPTSSTSRSASTFARGNIFHAALHRRGCVDVAVDCHSMRIKPIIIHLLRWG